MRKYKLELVAGEARAEVARRSMTYVEVAKKYGCSRENIYALMSKRYISEDSAQKLADAIGVPVSKITREIKQ